MTGRVPSARSSARLTGRSRTILFHVGSSWPATNSIAARSAAIGSPGRTSSANGSLCPHQIADRRVVAEQVDGLARLADRLLADRAGVAPLQREVLPEEHAELVGGVVELGPGDVAVDPQQVEAGVARRARRRGAARPASPRPRAMRVGPGLAPLRNSRSPLTVSTQSVHRHLRAARCGRRGRGSTSWSTDDRRPRRRSAAGRRATAATTAAGCRRRRSTRRRWCPAASDCSSSRSTAPSTRRADAHGAGLVAVEPARTHDVGPRRSSASRHSTRRRSMRTGPVALDAHRRQRPPGFQSGRCSPSAGTRR